MSEQADFDLIVIGSGPSGQRAAFQAAKLGKTVAVVDRHDWVGGVSIHTGTIPSKTFRQAILEDLAKRRPDVVDAFHPEHDRAESMHALHERTQRVVAAEMALVQEQFRRNGVGLLGGTASFEDEHHVRVVDPDNAGAVTLVSADNFIIAVGTRPARPEGIEFDDRRVIDPDGLLKLEHLVPAAITVVGAGVIGVEYASMFGAPVSLGVRVTGAGG